MASKMTHEMRAELADVIQGGTQWLKYILLAARRSLLDLDRLIATATATVGEDSVRKRLWADRIDTGRQRRDFGARTPN